MAAPPPHSRRGRDDPRLSQFTLIAHLLDQAFRIPGTNWRFGLDAIIGLIPGAGDVVGALVGSYAVWIARQLGAPPAVQARMLLNLAIDGIVGAIPILGDLFDFAFKAHVRNRVLLERWLAAPHTVRRGSNAMVAVVLIVLLLVVIGAVALAVAGIRALYSAFAG